MVEGASWEILVGTLRKCGAPEDAADADLTKFVGSLDEQRLVSVDQSPVREALFRLRYLGLWTLSVILLADTSALAYRHPSKRYPPSYGALVEACARAHTVNFLAGLSAAYALTTFTAVRSGLLSYTYRAYLATLWIILVFFLGLMASGVVHEIGHLASARRLKAEVTSVFARTGAAGVTFATDNIRHRRIIAMAGSGAALFVQLAAFSATFLIPSISGYESLPTLLRTCCVLFAVLQLWELLPFSEDGRILWQRRS
jgi:hypothetical protein